MSDNTLHHVAVPFDPPQSDGRVTLDAKDYACDQRVSVQMLAGAFYSSLAGAGSAVASPSLVSITSRRVFKDTHKRIAHMNASDPYNNLLLTPQQALIIAQTLVKLAGEALTLDSQRAKESST